MFKSIVLPILLFVATYVGLLIFFSSSTGEHIFLNALKGNSLFALKLMYPKADFITRENFDGQRAEYTLGFHSKGQIERETKMARKRGEFKQTEYKAYKFYLDNFTIPFILFIALSVMTPIAWAKHWFRPLIGLVLVWLFLMFRIWVFIRRQMGIADLDVYKLTESNLELFTNLRSVMELGFSIMVVIIIWFLLIFPGSSWYKTLRELKL